MLAVAATVVFGSGEVLSGAGAVSAAGIVLYTNLIVIVQTI